MPPPSPKVRVLYPYVRNGSTLCGLVLREDGRWGYTEDLWADVDTNTSFDTYEELALWLQMQGYDFPKGTA
jgi:hypothetical protein